MEKNTKVNIVKIKWKVMESPSIQMDRYTRATLEIAIGMVMVLCFGLMEEYTKENG
jgi:hypothetical protein